MAKKSRTYIWQFVIGLGFLSGLWTAIGIDPQAFFLNILGKAVETVYSDPVDPVSVSHPSGDTLPRLCIRGL